MMLLPSILIAATLATPSTQATPAALADAVVAKPPRCISQTLKIGSENNACVRYAQTLLKRAGMPDVVIDGKYGVGTTNAVVNFQRGQKLYDDGAIGLGTWTRLVSPRPVSKTFPRVCKFGGVNICIDQGQRKLFFFKNGKLLKTLPVRTGGYAKNKNGKWFVHRTQKGRFTLRAKSPNVWSSAYSVPMKWALMFNLPTGEYIHFSPEFASVGYRGSSHGCANIKSEQDAKWIFANTPLKSTVNVY